MAKEAAGIVVPNFKTINEFVKWTDDLSDQEIRSWQAKDWNVMYKKLFLFIDFSPEVSDKVLSLINDGTITLNEGETLQNISHERLSAYKRKAFLKDLTCAVSLGKLYRNYCPEPEQSKIINKLARCAGSRAASFKEVDSLKIYFEEVMGMYRGGLSEAMERVAEVVYDQTQFSKRERLNFEMMKFSNEEDSALGASCYDNGGEVPILILNHKKIAEKASLQTLFHESAHAFLQTIRTIKGKKIKPVYKLSDEFYELMKNNDKLYLSSDINPWVTILEQNKDEMLRSGLVDEYFSLYKLAQKNDYKSYQRQPVEWFAFLYGRVAERSFRKKSNQYGCEDNLEQILHFLEEVDLRLGRPIDVGFDDNGNFKLRYNSGDLCGSVNSDEIVTFFNSLFEGQDNWMDGRCRMKKNPEYGYEVTVANDYFTLSDFCMWYVELSNSNRELLNKFCKNVYFETVSLKVNGGVIFSCDAVDICYTDDQLTKKLAKVVDKKTLKSIQFVEFEDGKMLIFIPPKNSLEYQKLLNVFAREEDGWVEAERKRDIEKLKQKRLRFIKQAQMKRKIVQFFGGQKGR